MSVKVISPDLSFVNDVMSSGGESLKKCYQCATCSVVCNVTPDDNPFPRKEMMQAQWGMKEELYANPDIWLCHQCSDCTVYCPRGAKPGEVLGTIRQMSLEHYSKPSFLSRWLREPRYLLLLLVVPVLIILGLVMVQGAGSFTDVPRGDNGQIVYSKFVPTTSGIDPVFIAAALFAGIILARGVSRYWSAMSRHTEIKGGIVEGLIPTIKQILSHNKFRDCGVNRARGTTHMFVFYSFIGLAITTSMAGFYLYVLQKPSPYVLSDPLKIIGNISAIGLSIGVVLLIMNRFANAEKAGIGSYYDWLFIGVIIFVGSTGILSEVTRLADMSIAYGVYFTHLVAVLFLFIYAPFSKMAHIVYRTTAIVFTRMAGRS